MPDYSYDDDGIYLTGAGAIEATAPALAPGTYAVSVTNPSGTSAPAEKARFRVK